LRTFVALEIPQESVLSELVSVQEELKRSQADLRIVGRENLHFTVKFLGEISLAKAREVDERLKRLDFARVTVTVKGVGAFPNLWRPSVVWAGVSPEDAGKVIPIAERVIATLRDIGEQDNRTFQPHVTLARVKSARNKQSLISILERNADHVFGTTVLTHLKLKSSELKPRGPIYEDVGVYPLK